MRKIASASFVFLVVFLASLYLPMLYSEIFFDDIEKTHLFYSPVAKDFIFKEKVVGAIPDAVRQKAEDHHASISYQKSNGEYISRVEFEKLLPFIFYKNMEIWGLLPLELDGRTFTKAQIKKSRQVLELKSKYIVGNGPQTPVWPLLESNPGQARLVFPDDRFRMTSSAMEFINADFNRVDTDLSQSFTKALTDNGFIFPARSVNGKFTVLKPFDEGVFMVDSQYQVFHVKRVDGKPMVIKTPIDPAIQTRHIQVSENKKKRFYGLLLGGNGDIHLLSYDDYKLAKLPIENYDPDRMDIKLIFNPMYVTAIYSDQEKIYAVAMDTSFGFISAFSHRMSRSNVITAKKVYQAVFPFSFSFDTHSSGFLNLAFQYSGFSGVWGILACLMIYLAKTRIVKREIRVLPMLLVAITGIYGLAAVAMTGVDD